MRTMLLAAAALVVVGGSAPAFAQMSGDRGPFYGYRSYDRGMSYGYGPSRRGPLFWSYSPPRAIKAPAPRYYRGGYGYRSGARYGTCKEYYYFKDGRCVDARTNPPNIR
jgi:hypothetical protein